MQYMRILSFYIPKDIYYVHLELYDGYEVLLKMLAWYALRYSAEGSEVVNISQLRTLTQNMNFLAWEIKVKKSFGASASQLNHL